ncbi:putative ubiquitin carboxyl-terminal hydrolase 12 [Wickerhamiella sorbophila]|uniref:Ubiquitin carboxyl-terminal hydrolase n=1 Tax=Wickerhamiella sorbophila TaxID=45607 RepID=A0A2T0FIS4_9ASCO|nr:putative ubiquitin carboxyl-terminal hydrolase 12 [Wickerhamiella sorbophila]PRT54904.1 putative ubiquitin carboxyl-terminal hydrolase 12 [Wickerhamiella sorbophila]
METTGTKRLYSKLSGSSVCSDASAEPVIEIDAGNDVEADRISKILAIEHASSCDQSGEDDTDKIETNSVKLDREWWQAFQSPRSQPMGPVCKSPENGHPVSEESYNLLKSWYGEEALVTIPISVVASNETLEDRTLRATDLIGKAVDGIEGDLWVAKAWKPVISAVEFGRLSVRSVNRDSAAGDINLSNGDRLIVEPYDAFKTGTMGLTNLGNSCYMNSSLQCLVHVKELAAFFVSGKYRKDINKTNPIGYGGNVAEAFAQLVRHLYCDRLGAFSPTAFKSTIGRYNRAFAGYIQQDSQEFTAFLLDSLHEDLNRVVDKPQTEKPELPDDKLADPAAVKELADQCWDLHRKRNDSVILDLFTGLYKSTVVCPECGKVSVTFDPFSDLTLPLPSSNIWVHKVTFVPLSGPVKQTEVALDPFDSIAKLKTQVAGLVGVKASKILVGDIYDSQFYNFHDDNGIVSDTINASDDVVLYEVEGELPIAVYSRSLRSFGLPFLIMTTGDETVEQLRCLVDTRFKQFTGKEPLNCKLSKRPGGDRVLESTFVSSFYNLQSLDDQREPDLPESLESMKDAQENIEDVEMSSASSVSSLSGPVSSPEESFVSIKNTNNIIETTSLQGSAEKGPILNAGDILIAQFEDEFDFLDPEQIENELATAAQSRKVKETTLEDCLDAFEKPEVLGENDFWYCSNCKELRQATKQIELWTAPDILTIHLKRFSSFQSFRDKINDIVTFPITGLDMTSRVQGSEESLIYDLIAVDNHYGGLGGGHYTAYAKNDSDGNWYYFDDSSVTPADPEQTISGAAYLLFYRKRSSKPLGHLKPSLFEEAHLAATRSRQESRDAQRKPPALPARPMSPQEPSHPKIQALTPDSNSNQDLDSDELPGWTDIDQDGGVESDKEHFEDAKLSIEDKSSEKL